MISFLIIPFLGNGEDLEPFPARHCCVSLLDLVREAQRCILLGGMVISASSLPAREWG